LKEPKYPDDFSGWKRVDGWTTPLGGNYLVIDSPDGREQACIHVDDGDVLGIYDKLTGSYRYHGAELHLARTINAILGTGGKENAKKGSM
jgi:hypothetical protein